MSDDTPVAIGGTLPPPCRRLSLQRMQPLQSRHHTPHAYPVTCLFVRSLPAPVALHHIPASTRAQGPQWEGGREGALKEQREGGRRGGREGGREGRGGLGGCALLRAPFALTRATHTIGDNPCRGRFLLLHLRPFPSIPPPHMPRSHPRDPGQPTHPHTHVLSPALPVLPYALVGPGEEIISLSLNGDINYLDKSNPAAPKKVIRVCALLRRRRYRSVAFCHSALVPTGGCAFERDGGQRAVGESWQTVWSGLERLLSVPPPFRCSPAHSRFSLTTFGALSHSSGAGIVPNSFCRGERGKTEAEGTDRDREPEARTPGCDPAQCNDWNCIATASPPQAAHLPASGPQQANHDPRH